MHWDQNLKKLQIDITSHCNAKCGGCARNYNGGSTVNGLVLQHFDLEIFKELSSDTAGSIQQLSLNGNWGDPGMHPKLSDMMQIWVNDHPDCDTVIHTNGSMHKPEWWQKLAGILKNYRHRVVWNLDGIGDDHALYRRNTDFDKIVENMRAFNDASGSSEWTMTLWDHNIHYIDKAEKLASMFGCNWFSTRQTHTDNTCTLHDENNNALHTITAHKTRNIPTEVINLSNLDTKDIPRITYEDDHATKCPWYNQSEIQIDPFYNVWPCCHISTYGHIKNYPDDMEFDIQTLPNFGFNNLKNNNIYEILNHDWYKTVLPSAIDSGSYEVCRNNCGVR